MTTNVASLSSSSLTNLVAFYDEVATMVAKGRANTISLSLLYTKHLTLSCMTPLPLKWRVVVLTDEPLSG